MTLIGVTPLNMHGAALLAEYAAALEASSAHPVGRALAARPTRFQALDVRHHTGQGVEGVIGGVRMCIGSPAFIAHWNQLPLPRELLFVAENVQVAALATDREWLGLFTLGDSVRSGVRPMVQALRDQGAQVMLLSGDRESSVARVAGALGIPEYRAAALPGDKVAVVEALQSQGAVVAAVGDGINDAPLLAKAQVSVAMAQASELARLSSDVILLHDRIDPLLDAVRSARRTLRVIRQNLAWAVVYNMVAVPLAVMGLVTPLIAAVGMALSSVLVVGNALRLERA
mgnify:FL=1